MGTTEEAPVLHRKYDARKAKRDVRRGVYARNAAEAIGEVRPGCEIAGLFKGQFSLIDMVEHLLDHSGPADMVISTWTAAGADVDYALRLLANGKVRKLRFLVDFSFPSRQPGYAAALVEAFGEDCIRVSKNHAKFVLISNESWDLVLRTSANLNENRRLETFEVSDDPELAAFYGEIVDDIFRVQPDGAMNRRPYDNVVEFGGMWAPTDDAGPVPGTVFSDDPYGVDIRRTGVSYD
jgi:hypothetical protein